MQRGPDQRRPQRPDWKPEPLQLPVESEAPRRRRRGESDRDRPGSHVIVIDIA